MIKTLTLAIVGVVTLSACAGAPVEDTGANTDVVIPPELVNLAAPNQDISTARMLPEDRCYWYEHRGRVETTLLPVMTRNGRRICLPAQT
ncbi:hypothetical protein C7964_10839 [Loktanella sp. PT4BL]|jgi:hypothetical protein|uniref:hypothetical protein n=1 Tax=unclassified Loktanella TaxID=290910 RepID=UPI0006EB2920|nr:MULTISPECIES: hypothetical protein [unclassified Loktanella]KQI70904.1 hypothetical protein AN191_15590 [Loktanella sp. 5RATIMAR09]PXW67209.1 hypothetical protein C7964_10839 [Loktanella sp. PT4BL]